MAGFGRWRDAQRRRYVSLPFIDFSSNANKDEECYCRGVNVFVVRYANIGEAAKELPIGGLIRFEYYILFFPLKHFLFEKT